MFMHENFVTVAIKEDCFFWDTWFQYFNDYHFEHIIYIIFENGNGTFVLILQTNIIFGLLRFAQKLFFSVTIGTF